MKKTYVINSKMTDTMMSKLVCNKEVDMIVLTKNCIDATSPAMIRVCKTVVNYKRNKRLKFRLTRIKEVWAIERLLNSNNMILL